MVAVHTGSLCYTACFQSNHTALFTFVALHHIPALPNCFIMTKHECSLEFSNSLDYPNSNTSTVMNFLKFTPHSLPHLLNCCKEIPLKSRLHAVWVIIKIEIHLTIQYTCTVLLYEVFIIVVMWLAFESPLFVATSVNLVSDILAWNLCQGNDRSIWCQCIRHTNSPKYVG